MAFTLQKSVDGNLLFTAGKQIAGECCCGGGITCPSSICATYTGTCSSPTPCRNYVTCPTMKVQITDSMPEWAASTAYSSTAPASRVKSSGAGDFYECTTSGTSGGTEPIWNTGIGNTTNDGTVVWTRISNTIAWCGKSWTMPTDSGVEHEVCPERYALGNILSLAYPYGPTTGYSNKARWEAWSIADELEMSRRYNVGRFIFTGTTYVYCNGKQAGARLTANIGGGNTSDKASWNANIISHVCSPTGAWSLTVTQISLGQLAFTTAPGLTDYRLKSSFFSPTGVVRGGLVYHWYKGSNWP